MASKRGGNVHNLFEQELKPTPQDIEPQASPHMPRAPHHRVRLHVPLDTIEDIDRYVLVMRASLAEFDRLLPPSSSRKRPHLLQVGQQHLLAACAAELRAANKRINAHTHRKKIKEFQGDTPDQSK